MTTYDLSLAKAIDSRTKEEYEGRQDFLIKHYTGRRKEVDPNGVDQHAPGAKLDQGKQRPGLIMDAMPRALAGVVSVGTFGAAKYSDGGWLEVANGIQRYRDAQLRHESRIAQGELLDPESGLPHDFHRAWNVLAQVELKALRGDYASGQSTGDSN